MSRKSPAGECADEGGGAADRLVGVSACGAEHDQAGDVNRIGAVVSAVLAHFERHQRRDRMARVSGPVEQIETDFPFRPRPPGR